MTPSEKLLAIVDASKPDVERFEGAYNACPSSNGRRLLETLTAQRAEWQAARDLLVRLLAQDAMACERAARPTMGFPD